MGSRGPTRVRVARGDGSGSGPRPWAGACVETPKGSGSGVTPGVSSLPSGRCGAGKTSGGDRPRGW